MNFKIESNYITINNYPFLERHFEDMARKGWLIKRIIGASIFIYRKIRPEELDFSISLFEVESFLDKKTKRDLDEFHSVCEYVGWNFASSYSSFHIYYKSRGSQASPLESDEEESFNNLERLGKKEELSNYLGALLGAILSWLILKDLFTRIDNLKDGLYQFLSLMAPLLLILSICRIVAINRFLNLNRERIDLGKSISFNNSQYRIEKIIMALLVRIIILCFLFLLLSAIFVENYSLTLITFLPTAIGLTIGSIFRIFVKPLRKKSETKALILMVLLFIAVYLASFLAMDFMEFFERKSTVKNIEKYRIVSVQDLDGDKEELGQDFRSNTSLLIPRSYEFSSYGPGDSLVVNEYSRVLNVSIGKELVNRYIKRSERNLIHWSENALEKYIMGEYLGQYYESQLKLAGLTRDDLKSLKDLEPSQAKKEIEDLVMARSIGKLDKEIWNLDEAYYLNFERTELLLRDSKDVFYLSNQESFYLRGQDLSEESYARIIKEKLGLE